ASKPLDVVQAGAALGDTGAGVRERPKPEETGTALGGTLSSQVAHHACRLTDTAGPVGEDRDDAGTQGQPALPETDRVERHAPGLVHPDPGTEVAAQEHRAGWFRLSACGGDGVPDGGARLDLQDAGRSHRTAHAEEKGALAFGACGTVPVVSVAGYER